MNNLSSQTDQNDRRPLQKKDVEIKREAIDRAREILRGDRQISADEIMNLCRELEAKDQFSYATELLLIKMRLDENLKKTSPLTDHQRLAKYIYKDHSLPSSIKFDRAIAELEIHCNLQTTDVCETLGMAGSIYKYSWLYDHRSLNLDLSRAYYKRGFDSWKKYVALTDKKMQEHCNDEGYAAVNFAYINDLMAVDRVEEMGRKVNDLTETESLLEDAQQTRLFVLQALDANNITEKSLPSFWKLATIAEAYFGLRDYTNAIKLIRFSIHKKKDDLAERGEPETLAWQLRTFYKQLSSIAYLHYSLKEWSSSNASSTIIHTIASAVDKAGMNECLSLLADPLGDNQGLTQIQIQEEGKLGLALSGGGFRAAIYHIGVLAALAEQDILKDVEVISCVSGGSIIGAFYYLKLKKCLESQADGSVNYVEIVQQIEKEFLAGVQTNLRMQVFSNLWANLKMVISGKYSRTHRLGELYERHLYKKILASDADIYMTDLIIKPFQDPDFSLTTDNWKRRNKVPQLILNATTVNTGHNWQFTASWMGEPPGNILQGIDMKPRLRRMYYRDAPGDYKKFRLGHAVGASSCVPVLFEPMPMLDLYEDEDKLPLQVQLIDGGLHDNQGIAALIEQECKNMIISDASGQMSLQSQSSASEFGVFYRADTILQERLRELQFQDIMERHNTAQIKTLTSLHLKSELHQKPISWKYCQDAPRKLFALDDSLEQLTGYGILRDSQRLLSEIRTDLDSFNDVESYALMYSGYVQTLYKLRANNQVKFEEKKNWRFLEIKPFLTEREKLEKISKTLKTASKVPMKVLHLSNVVKIFTFAFGIVASLLLIAYGYAHRTDTIMSFKMSEVLILIAVLLIGVVSDFLADLINYRAYVRKKVILIVLGLIGFVAVNLYLFILNPVYNRAGKIPKNR
jgi:predicted acylesterase/phospholipase RssA